MFSTPNWFEHRNPLCLPEYHVAYQSDEYDKAMRHYGDACHAQLDREAQDRAWAEVWRIMQDTAKDKHRERVLRSVC